MVKKRLSPWNSSISSLFFYDFLFLKTLVLVVLDSTQVLGLMRILYQKD